MLTNNTFVRKMTVFSKTKKISKKSDTVLHLHKSL